MASVSLKDATPQTTECYPAHLEQESTTTCQGIGLDSESTDRESLQITSLGNSRMNSHSGLKTPRSRKPALICPIETIEPVSAY